MEGSETLAWGSDLLVLRHSECLVLSIIELIVRNTELSEVFWIKRENTECVKILRSETSLVK